MDLAWTGQPSIIVGLICLLLPSQISPAYGWSLPARDSAVSAPVGRHLNGKSLGNKSKLTIYIYFFESQLGKVTINRATLGIVLRVLFKSLKNKFF